jgi:GNAT superfamily N-acetyltransferase
VSNWLSQHLTEAHATDEFDSGNAALDRWLRAESVRAQRAGIARTMVWTPPQDHTVRAYFSLTPTEVTRAAVGGGMSGGYSKVPAYLLGRLALDRSLHGQGLGSELLHNALAVLVRASDAAGGRLIVVDAIDEGAYSFYRHHGFTPVGGTQRLVMKVSTAGAALSADAISTANSGL